MPQQLGKPGYGQKAVSPSLQSKYILCYTNAVSNTLHILIKSTKADLNAGPGHTAEINPRYLTACMLIQAGRFIVIF